MGAETAGARKAGPKFAHLDGRLGSRARKFDGSNQRGNGPVRTQLEREIGRRRWQGRSGNGLMNHRILVVDDNELDRMLVCDMLDSMQYTTTPASSVDEALDLLSNTPIQLLLTDLVMEGASLQGEDLVVKAQRRYPALPIVVMTNHGTVDKAVEMMKRGATDLLTKPLDRFTFLTPPVSVFLV